MGVKVVLCNIALRAQPDPFPPVACTSIINYLKRAGYPQAEFFDIDSRRPSDKKIAEYFARERFDIVGISAVVSTGYAYTKNLAHIIKKASPSTMIVVGGNLAATYEVLLRKCEIDICGIGEGERVMLSLVQYFDKHRSFASTEELKKIQGIAFLDENKELVHTGTGELVKKEELSQPDYDILAMYEGGFGSYVTDPLLRWDFSGDPRSYEPHRKGQKLAMLFSAKGCVNTCTFCHRWVKGYRVFPIENVINTIKNLKEKYNIGFFSFADECFGEDIRWLNEFIRQVAPLDVLFGCGGVRVGIAKKDPTMIRRLKEVGMVYIDFGMESGCDKILSVMEKRASTADNLRAAKTCAEAGVFYPIQLIVGMPGEDDNTIKDTMNFVIEATKDLPYPPILSINYLQSLPGTPSYDFLKHYNLVGKSIDEEERYLLSVSDVNACEFSHYINVTQAPLGNVMTWQRKLLFTARIAWLKEHHWKFTAEQKLRAFGEAEGPWYSLSHMKFILKTSPFIYRFIDLLGESFWTGTVMYNTISIFGFWKALLIFLGISKDDRSKYQVTAKSLKKIVADLNATPPPSPCSTATPAAAVSS